MTAAELAKMLHAIRTGSAQYKARCPGPLHQRGDRDPSLNIREGDDGRVLVLCRVGCPTIDVLKVLGLSMSALFSGPPRSPEQGEEAERERRRTEVAARARGRERRELADQYRRLNELQNAVAARLAHVVFRPEMPERKQGGADESATMFHALIDEIHIIEDIYERQERQGFHDRLVRYCDRHHIDRQILLARYMLPDEERKEAA